MCVFKRFIGICINFIFIMVIVGRCVCVCVYIYIYIYIYIISDSMLCSINDKLEKFLVKNVYFLLNMFHYIT